MPSSAEHGDVLVDRYGIEFVRIPSGKFRMGATDGDPDAEDNERPAHDVTIARSFYLGRFPVTLRQYRMLAPYELREHGAVADEHAVNFISCAEADAFVARLNAGRSSSEPGIYRLPTEAEWEYACRGGTSTRFHYGDDPRYEQLGDHAWFGGNVWDAGLRSPQPVGLKRPNPFGLYDLHGNVWEWTSDGWGAYERIVAEGEGARSGATRVLRGGAWCHEARYIRASDRDHYDPEYRHYYTGFRLCLDRTSP